MFGIDEVRSFMSYNAVTVMEITARISTFASFSYQLDRTYMAKYELRYMKIDMMKILFIPGNLAVQKLQVCSNTRCKGLL